MPLTRNLESPLISEDEVLRRAALLQLVNMPSLEGVKQLVQAMVFFLREKPEVAEEFVRHLARPPLAALAEEPVLHLLDDEDLEVREQAARVLYQMRIRTSSKARVLQALGEDESPYVRAYAAKALALLPQSGVRAQLEEAIDEEAELQSIARFGEALALVGEPTSAAVLRDQAEQLRERQPPAGEPEPQAWTQTAGDVALFLDALAARLEGSAEASTRPDAWRYAHPEHGSIRVAGGPARLGYAAELRRDGAVRPFYTDSRDALADLRDLPAI